MKIIGISDLHGNLNFTVPECDLLLIAGDVFPAYRNKIQSFFIQAEFIRVFEAWLNLQPCKKVIYIAGNHDWLFETVNDSIIVKGKITYLNNDAVKVGKHKVFGFPWSLHFNNWAFNCSEENIKNNINKDLLGQSDIWLFHSPMYGINDLIGGKHIGSKTIRKLFNKYKPKYYVHGHNHINQQTNNVYNVTLLNNNYELKNKPKELTS